MKLVEKIMSILKLDEAGKISKFFESLVKDSKRAIAQLESNKKASTTTGFFLYFIYSPIY